ncbi:MAG: tripartite tricarboxylate transporter permease, partial [Bacillota bacterium]
GIPSGPALAVLLGGLMMYGLQPGPTLFEKHGDFVWAVIASMYVGNVILLILNLPLVGLWAKLCKVPYPILAPMVLVFSFLGAYSVRFKLFDVGIALVFGLIGWIMKKTDFPASPLILCLILADMFETSLKQSLSMSQGNPLIFLSRPISLALIVIALLLAGFSIYTRYSDPKKAAQMMVESE